MFDDSQLLVRHIRTCFIQGDESGQCEQALEEFSKHSHSPPVALPDADECRDSAIERSKTGTSTKILYLTALGQLSMSEFYAGSDENENVSGADNQAPNLSDILATHFSNPFHRYSRFSAEVQNGSNHFLAVCPGVRTLTISVFLTSRSPEQSVPLTIHVNVTSARIVDLIGLTLWQYFDEKLEPALQDLEISHYALLSADDGEVDFAIPAFDPLEPLLKYGFSTMALVYVPLVFSKDKSGRPSASSPRSPRILPTQLTVTLSHYSFGTYQFYIDSKDVSLSKLIEMFLAKVADDPSHQRDTETLDKSHFTLEAETQPGRFCENLEVTLGRIGCYNFKVHRKYCNPSNDDKPDTGKTGPGPGRLSVESKSMGQIFHVAVERSKGKPVEVELVVEPDIIIFNQKEPNMSRSTPKSIVRATIESCRLVGADVGAVPGSKQLVRIQLTYKPNDNSSKKLILEIAAQDIAVKLVSLLQR